MTRTIIAIALVWCVHTVKGQKDSTLDIREFPVAKVNAPRGSSVEADLNVSLENNRSFDDLVFRLPINFRSGGLNDFAGISIRGAGLNQTKITWNGVPLNSALSGVADVSLLQTEAGTRLDLYTTGDGAIFGDQAVGGVIAVSDIRDTTRGWKGRISSQIASFRNYGLHAKVKYGAQTAQYYLGAQVAYGLNDYDFPYPEHRFWLNTRNQNAEVRMGNIRAGMSRQFDKSSHDFNYWYNRRMRQLSPLNNATSDSSFIEEGFHRFSVQSRWHHKKALSTSTVGFVYDVLNYTNPKYSIFSPNRFLQTVFNTQTYYRTFQFSTELNYAQFLETTKPDLLQLGLGIDKKWILREQYKISTSLKAVLFREKVNLIPSLRFQYMKANIPRWSISLSRVYRNPTINELYFVPGGNPDLKSEIGWNFNTSWMLQNPKSIVRHLKFSFYSRHIENWVLWYGSFVFSPYNIGTVRSRGIELISDISISTRPRSSWHIRMNAGYVRSILREASDSNFVGIVNDQLPYTPEILANMALIAKFERWGIDWKHHYQSSRTAVLTSMWTLQPFYIMDLSAYFEGAWHADAMEQHRSDRDFQVRAGIKNITNSYYEYTINRPMPGRNYFLEFSIFL